MESKLIRPYLTFEEDIFLHYQVNDAIAARLKSYTKVKAKRYQLCRCQYVRNSGVAPIVKLNNGKQMPSFGLGTWLGFSKGGEREAPKGDEVQKAVEWAIDAGYRHIDTAHIYGIEDQVGKGIQTKIADGTVKREQLFITTKLWNDRHAKADVVPGLKESLEKLELNYVDLYLIHWPVAQAPDGSVIDIDYLETWQGMIEAMDQGLARSIGVSNFNKHMVDRVISQSHVKPAVLQVEINLNLQQPALLDFCRQQNIYVMAYTPFGSLFPSKALDGAPPPRINDAYLIKITDKYKKTVPQVVLRYLVELGVIPIPKSITESRIQENIQVFDFQLTPAERNKMRRYDKNYRTIPVKVWKASPYYPFEKN